MVTCSFLGHGRLYDEGLYPSILEAVNQVVNRDTEIEFVFDRQTHFQFLCLCAVLETRQHNPGKLLKITFMSRNDINEQEWEYPGINGFPFCIFDKIIKLPELTCPINKAHIKWRRERRKLVDYSDFLACYEYPDLWDDGFEMYKHALRCSTLTIFNVANDKTAQAIKEDIARLETKQQYIIQAVKSGKSL